MKQRIFALVLLLGFVFVMLNILFLKINAGFSVIIYGIYIVYYLLVLNKKKDT